MLLKYLVKLGKLLETFDMINESQGFGLVRAVGVINF